MLITKDKRRLESIEMSFLRFVAGVTLQGQNRSDIVRKDWVSVKTSRQQNYMIRHLHRMEEE